MTGFIVEEDWKYQDPNRRFQLLNHNNLPSPGACITCGTIDRDCIWFGANNFVHIPGYEGKLDQYGSVLICTECFISGVRENPELGMVTREYYDEGLAAAREDVSKLDRVDSAVIEFNDAIRVASSRFADAIATDIPDAIGLSPVPSKPAKAAKREPATALQSLGEFGLGG